MFSADSLVMENCTFKWAFEDDVPVLRNISLRIKPGSLVGVVGAVGAGKSSLLAAFLGEMDKVCVLLLNKHFFVVFFERKK